MADLVFAFDPAIDRPLPAPEAAPAEVADRITAAAAEAFDQAVALALTGQAAALVVCGRLLDARRASPAQAALVRRHVQTLAAQGAQTIFVADAPAACHELARLLGEPAGLRFVTPGAPLTLDVRGLAVEINAGFAGAAANTGNAALPPLTRRIVVGWDTALWQGRWSDEPDAAAFPGAAATLAQPDTVWIWGSRQRRPLPPGVHHLPPLQARSSHESSPGAAGGLTLLDRGPDGGLLAAVPHADWRGSWREIATHQVAWRVIAVESPAGGDEELATALWAALEAIPAEQRAPLELVCCAVQCGTSVARRVRVGELAAETLARVRQLYDQKTFRVWCHELFADPGEPLEPLGHARSGSRPGTTTSFSSALADIVTALERLPAPPIPADLAREAGWLALELVEST